MAGDFTQVQPLTRHCRKICHLQQTCQLTTMQLGIETDQFPNCQQDMALMATFYFVKSKKYRSLGYIVNFSLASQASDVPRYRRKRRCATNLRFKKRFSVYSSAVYQKFGPPHTSVLDTAEVACRARVWFPCFMLHQSNAPDTWARLRPPFRK